MSSTNKTIMSTHTIPNVPNKAINYPYSPFNQFNDSVFDSAIFNASEAWAGFQYPIFSKNLPLETRLINYLITTGNSGKSRAQIAQSINAARTTIFDAIQRLTLSDDIEINYKKVSKKGRPTTLYYAKKVQQGARR